MVQPGSVQGLVVGYHHDATDNADFANRKRGS